MKLDQSKKYEGFGCTWVFASENERWYTEETDGQFRHGSVCKAVMQALLDAGHIKPARKTKIVRVENATIEIRANGVCILRGAWPDSYELVKTGAVSLPTVVEFTVEVADEVTR
jgi:hypothetical protein